MHMYIRLQKVDKIKKLRNKQTKNPKAGILEILNLQENHFYQSMKKYLMSSTRVLSPVHALKVLSAPPTTIKKTRKRK